MSDQLLGDAFTHGLEDVADLGGAGSPSAVDAFRGGKPDTLFSRRSRATRTGLQIKDGLEFESWSRIGFQVTTLANASAWWIGDWLLYGQKAYPGRYRSVIEATGFSYQTLRNYAWVASRFPLYRRRDTLSFGHHAEVASLDEAEQELWLARSITHGWSRNKLRLRLRNSGQPQPACTPVAIVIQIEEPRRELWQAAAIAQGSPLTEWITAVVDAATAAVLIDG